MQGVPRVSSRWQYFRDPDGGGDGCEEEIQALFDASDRWALRFLIVRKIEGCLLEAERREIDHTLSALVLPPPHPPAGVIYADLAEDPKPLILLPFALIDDDVPEEARIRAHDRFRRWTRG